MVYECLCIQTFCRSARKKGGAGATGRGSPSETDTVCTNELLRMRKMGMPLRPAGEFVPLGLMVN